MFVHINGLKTYYETLGSGEPVLLLHGWGVSSESMRPILMYFGNSSDFKAFSLDFPGFGLSDCPGATWSVNDYVAQVLAFLDRLCLTKVSIVGHSFGGRVAIKLAARYPQRVAKLVLVDSAGIRPTRSALYYFRVLAVKLVRLLTSVLPRFAKKKIRERILSQMGSADYRSAGELRSTFVKIVNEDLREFLPLIESPTLLIWGGLDTATPLEDARLIKKLIPNSRLEVIDGAGHFCYLDDFTTFTNLVSGFLGMY